MYILSNLYILYRYATLDTENTSLFIIQLVIIFLLLLQGLAFQIGPAANSNYALEIYVELPKGSGACCCQGDLLFAGTKTD